MRKVILYIATSLDGYIAETDGSIDFLTVETDAPEEDNSYEELLERIDTVVLGRTTYDQVVNELSPEQYPYEDKTSYIITHHEKPENADLIFTAEQPDKLVERLKKEEGKDIWIVGGGQVITPLINCNLIDEYIVTTIPVILGQGIPLFQSIKQSVVLKSVDSYCKNGMITSTYSKV
ncbi:dihydrofolate reductase family protein [Enterococcus sp. CWB-B31]|nr:dihydrofolate reductase family protein [Enterococcus sp. CWB-B31]MCB5954690.1 dihydrofolate reductase family protein [Enterococcus sp. CWB-B31]